MAKHSLDKDKIKILLLEGVHQTAVDVLERAGYTNIEYHKASLGEEALLASIKDAHFVGLRSRTQLTAEVLHHAEKLVAIGCFCIGTNQVDLASAEKLGIPVFNAPFSNTRSVAELVIGEIIMLMRGIPQRNAMSHRGGWLKSANGSVEVRGKTLGVIGYGHIGTQLGILAETLGMRVIFFDIEDKLPLGNASQVHSMDKLLAQADVVSLHVPETPQTKDMFAKAEFAQMRQGSFFINASRGTVVDIEDLANALKSEHLAGAAIDVFPVEPKSNDDEFISPLRGLDNVLLTPHIGGSTAEAQENIGVEVAGKLVKYSDNGSTLSAVNFPEVSLAQHSGTSRLLHIHQNRPGVLIKINQAFSEKGINIAAQYLQTTAEIGYVVMEVDSDQAEEALVELKSIEGTIRARVLF
ncbi:MULTISPECIES: phosphoglycerate dehydrogenase [Shewanella]|jgi:D-3-phosphoglycerate dehydrogenase|uniref:D-3-phosphoglycerate dehydrogenase n=2 Tax=Shewanella frigidimarina TaxID=56812 RepID=Q087Z6_SHEFN|nr:MULTISPECIES: phosphoglycerate dehydrogenase [Shewanella]ABI70419.1 D-3-phosphoglycerate dehydrogenase [Shewanella frigidimarina NCIMB 400]KVX00252.1 D-3-phosphoglycerate dehydrogenase [Shewanella frigidimarina]MBB1425914.1 phosphoglycerate dehydrogenase [Shewanella sp. SG44-2]PKI07470.1 phosphoglycerate dehydrogenase [Shewanella sp. 11B5]RPA30484.1 phosphoglycerate dehydrogenase [Shewanella frigidimarina]|tara:strand:+ start:6070 stop:7299 length:1230 start_codon:yes stop_codon:yes gene_type:complete